MYSRCNYLYCILQNWQHGMMEQKVIILIAWWLPLIAPFPPNYLVSTMQLMQLSYQ